MRENILRRNNPYNDDKVIAACSIFGAMDRSGKRMSAHDTVRAIANMHVRSNGLGGGFAGYGIYPEHPGHYALHVMYLAPGAREELEARLARDFSVALAEPIPLRPGANVWNAPELWRYFALPTADNGLAPDDYVMGHVMRINSTVEDAFIFSSGKNMGVFKGVGFPEDVADFFRLDDYQGYIWVAHGRFPTNTPGWWGGAHPFNLLDWTVVHNGEISSYDTNRRFLEMYGYCCTMMTDTEVVAYAVDLLMRRHGLPIELVKDVLAPRFWQEIDRESGPLAEAKRTLRQVYSELLLNGPFTVIIAHNGEMIGLTDRIRLRPLTAATRGDVLYLSSEESAIRLVSPQLDRAWIPDGGEPVVGRLGKTEPVAAQPMVSAG